MQLLCSGAGAPQQTSLVQCYVRGIYKPFFQKAFPNMLRISSKASDGHTCRLVGTGQRVLLWLHLRLYGTKEGNSACTKKRQHFHLKAGRKNARQFVCGRKAAHSRQKGKLYQCNFPRQISRNSESLLPSPAMSFPLAVAISGHSFPPLPLCCFFPYPLQDLFMDIP